MSDEYYTIRSWDTDDVALIPRLVEVLHQVFPKPEEHTKAWFRWKHVDNVCGPSIVTYAETPDGQIAAVRAFWRQSMRFGDQSFVAFQPCDTATTPQHRGRGLFKRLTLSAIETSVEANAKILFNYPTGNARAANVSIGWCPVNAAQAWWRPLRCLQVAKKCLRIGVRDVKAVAIPTSNWNFNVTAPDFANDGNVISSERPAGYHHWRFGSHPNHRYFVCGPAELKAVVRLRQRRQFIEALIVDLWTPGGECSAASVKNLVSDLKGSVDADVVTCVLGTGSRFTPLLRKAGFWKAPHDIHHYVRYLESPSVDFRDAGWALQGADIDTY